MAKQYSFTVLLLLLFSSVLLGQGSPNIIWEVQSSTTNVYNLSISADANTIFTSDENTIKFWNASGNFINEFSPGFSIIGATFSPVNDFYTAGYLQGIYPYPTLGFSLVNQSETDSLIITTGGAHSIFNPNGSKLITAGGGFTRTVMVYNTQTWYDPISFNNGSDYITSLDASENYIAVGSDGNVLRLWNINTGDLVHTFTGYDNHVSSVKFSQDGNLIASGQGGIATGGSGAIKIWNVNDFSLVANLPAFQYWANSITFSSDGLYMIASGRDGYAPTTYPKIKIWRTSDWTLIETYDSNLDGYVPAIVNVPDNYRFVYSTNQGNLIMADYSQVVPVELSAFTADVNGNSVTLNWSTSTETNNKGFELLRKESSNNNWDAITFIYGAGTSTNNHRYVYTDKPGNGSFQYRLKQVDFDGISTLSNIANAVVSAPNSFSLSQNYPNPFNPTTNISYILPEKSEVSLIVYNLIGQQVGELVIATQEPGSYNIKFNGNNLSSGVYLYVLKAGSFTATKKLILLK